MDTIIWYDCPACGKEKSCSGDTFCGACEEKYQKEIEAAGQFKTEQEMLDYYARLNE